MRLRVAINGADDAPVEIGFASNPFPRRAKPGEALEILRDLDRVPVRSTDDIARRLKGFHPSFISLMQRVYCPGAKVVAQITIPDHAVQMEERRDVEPSARETIVLSHLWLDEVESNGAVHGSGAV